MRLGALNVNRIKDENGIAFLWEISFILCMFTNFSYPHTTISTIFLLSFCVFTFIAFMSKGGFIPKISPLLVFYFLFIVYSYLNIVTGHSINTSNSYNMISTMFIGLTFFGCVLFFFSSLSLVKIKNIMVNTAIISSIVMLVINYNVTKTIIIRGSGTINPNSLAVIDALMICWIVCDGHFFENKKSNIAKILFFILFCLSSGTRKAIIAVSIGIIISILIRNPKRIVRNLLIVFLLLIVGFYILMEIPLFYDLIGYRLNTLFTLLQGGEGEDSEVTRMHFIEKGLDYYHQSPIWGNGVNCFKEISSITYKTYSHNNYVELLFSTGIIGTAIYYCMYLYILINAFREYFYRKTKNIELGICMTIAILFNDIAAVSYYSRETFALIAICWCLVSSERNESKSDPKKQMIV